MGGMAEMYHSNFPGLTVGMVRRKEVFHILVLILFVVR